MMINRFSILENRYKALELFVFITTFRIFMTFRQFLTKFEANLDLPY